MICSKQEPSTVEVMMEMLHGSYDSKQFLPGHTVISFWSGQTLVEVDDDMLFTIYFFGQHCSDALMACFCIQNKLFPSFRICQDWSRSYGMVWRLLRNFSRISGSTCRSPKNSGSVEHPSGSSSFPQLRSYPGLSELLLPKRYARDL
ncbi:hypothetical protein TNCT_340021 [Trichonephila clavata]|uniref:Uncharacterized protein n=1 Tax=Trichonephila clavata TaxID=2740835 RepID=A0A8X6L7F6_TRICU|nr:hypothetical protein TNCT_340021 [Trichonephila clavata]